jgi:hypothetical protein
MSNDHNPIGALHWTLLVLSAAFVSGCATAHRVTIDSLARPGADAVSYSMRNTNPSVAGDSVRYREAEELVKTALSGRGLYEAPANTKPDVIVDLAYGVGPPKVRREKQYAPLSSWELPGRIDLDRDGFLIIPQRREVSISTTTYEKYLRLTARESVPATPGRPPAEIWTVDVISEGESQDIRKYLPILAAASIDYIGRDSHGHKTIRIKDTDADVVFVKKGMTQKTQ